MALGFYTDTSVCIGCKACQVACHQWNQLPSPEGGARELSGESYDNTLALDALNWRHVKFIEQIDEERSEKAWLMMSDVCKHCREAPCEQVCPTHAIIRTEFDTVFIQPDVCNGCRDCIAACPFGVIGMDEEKGVAQKCTLCYDRLQNGLQPACSAACPTASIQFGDVDELRERARARVVTLRAQGHEKAQLYGDGPEILGGLNSFYLLLDEPQVYGLPPNVEPSRPKEPPDSVAPGSLWAGITGVAALLGMVFSFRGRGARNGRPEPPPRAGEG
ncbi:MAG: 4Fe-4S dicluster domain-containing protein [Gemmatimonadota bacterium]